jgi:anaerobic magnesium-protoporphyrin IX monomethyl ester cyclase
MKILLLDVYIKDAKYRICKDTNGSYGTANDYGDSLFPKLLSKIAKNTNFWPPIYLMYVGAVLRDKGHEVSYSNNIKNEELFDCIIMSSSIVCHESELNEIKKIKDKNKIIVVGSFATSNPENYLDLGVKVILGEPEFYFLRNELSLILKNQNNKSFHSMNKDNENLDELPIPCWDLVVDRLLFSGGLTKKTCIPILSERGCPYSCFNYCTYPLAQGRVPRARSTEGIVKELKFWNEKFGVKEFVFRDPVFSINRERTIDLANMMINENLDLKFTIETHLNNLDYDLLQLLKRAGVFIIRVGVESVNDDVIKNAKRFSLKKSKEKEKIEMIRSFGIKVIGMYILGFETDTKESCLRTIKYAKELNTYIAVFSVFTPYPGTPIFIKFKEKITTKKYEDFNQWKLVFRHDNITPKEIRGLLDYAFTSYYLSIRWFIKNFLFTV